MMLSQIFSSLYITFHQVAGQKEWHFYCQCHYLLSLLGCIHHGLLFWGNSTTRNNPAYGIHHPKPEDVVLARDYVVGIGAVNDFIGSIFRHILVHVADWLKVLNFVCKCIYTLVLISSFVRLAQILL